MDTNWDLHKENVQPLSQGRKMSELNKFLTLAPNSDETKKREETRREFEDLLRCDSDDKLAIWYDYINWVEQNYPEGGEDANLRKLIENCISDLFNDSKYHQDKRFFAIFLRYIRIVDNALELFNIMFTSNIFTTIAAFYVNWANLVEKNLSKAEEIIRFGIERLAQPSIQLEWALKEIQLIAAENKDTEFEEEEDVRKPFIPLKVEKKSGRTLVPVERLANYDDKKYKLSNNQQETGKANSQIQFVFTDENNTEIGLANQQEIIKKLPTNNQENSSKASRWCDNKIISKPRLDQAVPTKFEIYDKESNECQTNDDLKSRQQTNTQANAKLKELKKDEKSPRLVIFEKLAPNQRFFCDLKKIYCGGTEYSFEEIRSIRLKLAKKKDEDRFTKEKLRKEVQDLKQQISTRENLFNDVEQMKKKLELLLKQNLKVKPTETSVNKSGSDSSGSTSGQRKQQFDPIEQHCTKEKQCKFDDNLLNSDQKIDQKQPVSKSAKLTSTFENSNTNYAKVINQIKDTDEFKNDDYIGSKNSLKEGLNRFQIDNVQQSSNTEYLNDQRQNSSQNRADLKEDLTIVRDLWNGSIEENEFTVDIEREMVNRPQAGDFSIFKDDDDLKNNANKFNNKNYQDTFALPKCDSDFGTFAKHASTPANFEMPHSDSTTLDENCTINVFQLRDNKILSPIVETSKEYKSSSSSSLSGFSSYHKSRTFHK